MSRPTSATAGVLCAVLATVVLASAARATEPTTQPTTQRGAIADDRLDVELRDLDYNQVPLADVIDYLRDESRATLLVDWKQLQAKGVDRNTPVTLRLREPKLIDAVNAVIESAAGEGAKELAVLVDRGVLVVTSKRSADAPRAEIPTRGDAKQVERVRAALARPLPSVDFNQVTFGDVVEFLKDVTQVAINVKWDELQQAGIERDIPVTLHARNLPLDRTLELLSHEVSGGTVHVAYGIDGDEIVISTEKDLLRK